MWLIAVSQRYLCQMLRFYGFQNSPVCTFSSIHENWRFSFIFCLEIKVKVSPGKQFSLQFKESLFAHSHCFKRHFTILIESNPSNSLYSKRNLSVFTIFSLDIRAVQLMVTRWRLKKLQPFWAIPRKQSWTVLWFWCCGHSCNCRLFDAVRHKDTHLLQKQWL